MFEITNTDTQSMSFKKKKLSVYLSIASLFKRHFAYKNIILNLIFRIFFFTLIFALLFDKHSSPINAKS